MSSLARAATVHSLQVQFEEHAGRHNAYMTKFTILGCKLDDLQTLRERAAREGKMAIFSKLTAHMTPLRDMKAVYGDRSADTFLLMKGINRRLRAISSRPLGYSREDSLSLEAADDHHSFERVGDDDFHAAARISSSLLLLPRSS